MHVMIQGGEGVYANTGSCVAAAMYCEHERKELMDKGLKPEAFFHQYSDFVSTNEVIDRIDNNKKKLCKKDAKFYVITVNPSAEEQRKMGDTIEERTASFKNYIRNGVMKEYAKNFKRNLTANDIMYYAYIHVNRGNKEGQQMHAHIIVSRRDMSGNISISPNTNHRNGKGVIAHGFNRDGFYGKCEQRFDEMMDYTRAVEESYNYRNSIKNGDYQDMAAAVDKAVQEYTGIDLNEWERVVAESVEKAKQPVAETVTAKPVYSDSSPSLFTRSLNFVRSLFGRKKTEMEEDAPNKDRADEKVNTDNNPVVSPNLYMYKDKTTGLYCLAYYEDGKRLRFAPSVDMDDVHRFYVSNNSKNKEKIEETARYLSDKYFVNANDTKNKLRDFIRNSGHGMSDAYIIKQGYDIWGIRYKYGKKWESATVFDRILNKMLSGITEEERSRLFADIRDEVRETYQIQKESYRLETNVQQEAVYRDEPGIPINIDIPDLSGLFVTNAASGASNNKRRRQSDDEDDGSVKKKKRRR